MIVIKVIVVAIIIIVKFIIFINVMVSCRYYYCYFKNKRYFNEIHSWNYCAIYFLHPEFAYVKNLSVQDQLFISL